MTNKIRLKLGIILLGLSSIAATAGAQIITSYDTEVGGSTNVVDGDTNVAASGDVTFYPANPDYDLTISVSNDTYGPDIDNAVLTGFYILAPWTSEAAAPAAEADLVGFSLATDGSNPAEWSNDNNFNNVLNEFSWPAPINNGNQAEYLYFGASTGSGSVGLDIGESASFNFVLEDDSIGLLDVNWDAYFESELPHIFLRWQTVEDEFGDEIFGGSAKGYTYFTPPPPIIIPPVPEPAEIALLSLLGLGGIVWLRKRFSTNSNKR